MLLFVSITSFRLCFLVDLAQVFYIIDTEISGCFASSVARDGAVHYVTCAEDS